MSNILIYLLSLTRSWTFSPIALLCLGMKAAALQSFRTKLHEAVNGENVVYVISEREHLPLLPDGSIRVLVTADLEVIKTRFAVRMHGNLPAPVAAMLERKHGSFDMEPHHIHVISEQTGIDDICRKIAAIQH